VSTDHVHGDAYGVCGGEREHSLAREQDHLSYHEHCTAVADEARDPEDEAEGLEHRCRHAQTHDVRFESCSQLLLGPPASMLELASRQTRALVELEEHEDGQTYLRWECCERCIHGGSAEETRNVQLHR
jgi:hypothetical protein